MHYDGASVNFDDDATYLASPSRRRPPGWRPATAPPSAGASPILDVPVTVEEVVVQASVTDGVTVTATITVYLTAVASVVTTASPSPGGSGTLTSLYRLPCAGAGAGLFERAALASVASSRAVGGHPATSKAIAMAYPTGDRIQMAGAVASVLTSAGFGASTPAYGLQAHVAASAASDLAGVAYTSVQLTTVDAERANYDYTGSTWNLGLVADTLHLVQGGTKATQFTLAYSDGSVAFSYGALFTNSYWFTPQNVVSFDSTVSGVASTAFVSVDGAGTLTLADNYEQKVSLRYKVCGAVVGTHAVYANLQPDGTTTPDVDMGSRLDGLRSPYYYESGDLRLHLWIQPRRAPGRRSDHQRAVVGGVARQRRVRPGDVVPRERVLGRLHRQHARAAGVERQRGHPVHGQVYIGYVSVPAADVTASPGPQAGCSA